MPRRRRRRDGGQRRKARSVTSSPGMVARVTKNQRPSNFLKSSAAVSVAANVMTQAAPAAARSVDEKIVVAYRVSAAFCFGRTILESSGVEVRYLATSTANALKHLKNRSQRPSITTSKPSVIFARCWTIRN